MADGRLVAEETLIFDMTEAIAEVRSEWPGGVSYGDLSKRTGISKAHLIRLMRGEGNPTLRTLASVAHALGHRFTVKLEPVADPSRERYPACLCGHRHSGHAPGPGFGGACSDPGCGCTAYLVDPGTLEQEKEPSGGGER